MKIKELNIIEFGGLSSRSFSLTNGLNIIEGENETGKSTLWLFVKFMLYGMAKKGTAERERSLSRNTHRASGTMTLSCGGEDYRIERTFADGTRGKVTTYRLSDGEQVFAGTEPGEGLLGVPREIFDSSVGIAQSACAAMGGEKGAAAIRNILSSADESVDIERIEKRLEAVRVLYRHKNGKGGKLYDLSEEINSAKTRLARATEGRLKVTELESRVAYNTSAMTGAEEKLSALRNTIGIMQKQEILGRFDSAAQLEEEYKRHKSEYDELQSQITVDGRAITFPQAENARVQSDSLDRAKKEFETAELERKKLDTRIDYEKNSELVLKGETVQKEGGASALISQLEAAKKKRTVGIVLMVMGFLGAAAFGALSVISMLFLIGTGVSLVASGIGALLAFSKPKGINVEIPEDKNIDAYLEDCEQAYEAFKTLCEEAKRAAETEGVCRKHYDYVLTAYAEAAQKIGCDPESESIKDDIQRVCDLIQKSGTLKAKTDELLSTVKRERELLSAYNESELRAELDGIPRITEDLRAVEEKKRYYEESLRMLRSKDNSLRTELINLKATSDDPVALSDRISELQAEYDKANEYYEAVLTATDGLRRAAETMRGSVTPIIGRDAAKIVGQITDNRYDGMTMGRDMSVSLSSSDGLTTTYDMMSGGMRDAAYIALRISLMMRIFGGELPPVMMDEALCQIDDGRMTKILLLLSRLCEDGCQVLLFTCHKREAETCREMDVEANIITMSAPL